MGESNSLAGQWLGLGIGEYESTVLIDLDTVNGRAIGTAHFFPNVVGLPPTYVDLSVEDNVANFECTAKPIYFNSSNGYSGTLDEATRAFPGVSLSQQIHIKMVRVDHHTIHIDWQSDQGFSGKVELSRMRLAKRSSIVADLDVSDWKKFQEFATEEAKDGFIYRGQESAWPLQTSFHRTERKNLRRYVWEDIPRLHRAVAARTKSIFDLDKPEQNGAFLNLAQHHGYPTPLLDWTFSPFVAAYFAYSGVDDFSIDDPVRIFALDQVSFRARWEQIQHLALVKPHFSVLEAMAIENERAIPQQAVLALTNLHDIEHYILHLENVANTRYLFAIDLPRNEGPKVLRDLRMMGITQSTMFPGIESICREMRLRNFPTKS